MKSMNFNNLLHSPYIERILSALQNAGGTNRFIGGCVRDTIAKKNIKDIDIATDLLPPQVQKALDQAQIKNLPIGFDHGTITAIIDKHQFEITTLRKDISTDGRKAIVTFTTDWLEDANRRDFTINAMSYCPIKNVLYDYFDGISDLKQGIVKFIGNPNNRIQEDYLRILRYFRFLGYYSSENLDQASFDACKENASRITKLSAERKYNEFSKILQAPEYIWVIALMLKSGVLQELITNLRPNFFKLLNNINLIEKELDSEINHLTKLFSIIDSSQKSVQHVSETFKLTNKQTKYLYALCKIIPKIKENQLLELIYQYGQNEVLGALIIHLATDDRTNMESCLLIENIQKLKLKLKTLPISGNDIMKVFDLKQSIEIGQLLHIAQDHWIKSNFSATKQNLLNLLQKHI